eukprot:gene3607-4535_t
MGLDALFLELHGAASHHGNIWDDIYVNTEKKQLGLVVGTYWTSLPTEEWGHIHMEPTEIIADDITIFAQVEVANSYTSGCMAGTLAELYLWSQPLLPEELAIIYQGFDQTTAKGYLAAYFALEEGEGDVAWDHIDRKNRWIKAVEPQVEAEEEVVELVVELAEQMLMYHMHLKQRMCLNYDYGDVKCLNVGTLQK